MNKFEEFIKKFQMIIKRGNKKDKIKMCLAMLLMGVVICIVFKGFSKKGKNEEVVFNSKEQPQLIHETVDVENDLEVKLEKILKSIKGIGNVEVLISYEDNGEKIPMENISKRAESESSSGYTENSIEKEIILEDKDVGDSVAVRRVIRPSVRGVIVVAEGVESYEIKQELIQAVSAVTGVGQHRIKVWEGLYEG